MQRPSLSRLLYVVRIIWFHLRLILDAFKPLSLWFLILLLLLTHIKIDSKNVTLFNCNFVRDQKVEVQNGFFQKKNDLLC